MQLIILAFGLLSLIPFTLAQALTGLPACAETCALNAISGSGCPVTNTTCICNSATFISSYNACVGTSCNATDATTATQFGIQYCAAAGVTLNTASSGASASTATSSDSKSVEAGSTAGSAGAATTTGASATSASSGTAATTVSNGQSGSSTSSAPSASGSGSASSGAAQLHTLGSAFGWMLTGVGLAAGLVAVQL